MAPSVPKYLERVSLFVLVCAIAGFIVSAGKRITISNVRTSTSKTTTTPSTMGVRRYSEVVCEDAFRDVQEPQDDHFEITLREGCFDAMIHFPPVGWDEWAFRTEGDDPDAWYAIWFNYAPRPEGVYDRHSPPVHFEHRPPSLRMQGKEGQKLFFYTMSPLAKANRFQSAPPKLLSHLSIQNGDPHLCDKPPDAFYGILGSYFHAEEANNSVGHPPQYLFDSNRGDDMINWANGFKGDVPVCVVIDMDGNPQDITFPQPPGAELEGHIKDRISGWRYRPGYLETGYNRDYVEKKVRVELAYTFGFQ